MKTARIITVLAFAAVLAGCSGNAEAAPEKTRVTSSPAPSPSPTVVPDPTTLKEALAVGMGTLDDPIKAIGVMEDITTFAKDELKPAMRGYQFDDLTLFQFKASLAALNGNAGSAETIAAAQAYTYMVQHAAIQSGVLTGPVSPAKP